MTTRSAHPSSARTRRAGFTLVECISVVVMLSIAFPPMLWAIRQAHVSRVTPARLTLARWLAAEKLEDITADRHSLTRGYTYVVAANYAAEASLAGFPGFTRSVAIAETGPDLTTAGTGYKRITVTVGYTDGAGTARTFALSAVLTDY